MAKKAFTPIPPMAELPPAEEINVREILDKYLTGEIDLICVLGPTASGKTRYAVKLAREINALLTDPSAEASAKEKRATPLAAGGGARSEGVGGVLFAADTHRMGKALIVGLGGAGKAAAAAAESLGMEVIRMNRTVRDEYTRPLSDFRECFREADIIIYNIPAAIPELEELTDSDFAPGKPKFIMEANYKNPSFDEALINRMKEANPLAEYTGGKTWLLYQAVTGYEIFTGEKPDLQRMSDVL